MKPFLISLLAISLLTACQGGQALPPEAPSYPNEPPSYPNEQPPVNEPAPPPYAPQPSDDALTRSVVYLDKSELLILESYPVRIVLALRGSLPTPCNQLRVVATSPDEQNQIQIEVYSVIDPELMCVQVLEAFDVNIALGSFPTGHYTVWVNGNMVGEFDA